MYKIKYDFSKVSNETEAYILGFIYADGYIISGKINRLGITLAKKDEVILEKILRYISDEIPITYESRAGFNDKIYDSVRFVLCREEIVENLKKLGVLPNKTGEDFGIPVLKNELYRHFIRGYFDGDGGMVKDRDYIKFFIVSPLSVILLDFQKILKDNKINSILYHDKRKGKPSGIGKSGINNYDQYRLLITKHIHLERIFNFLYKDCTIKLDRKYDIFNEYFKRIKPRKSYNTEFLEYNGITKTLKEWSLEKNIGVRTLYHRLNKAKWPIDEVFSYSLRESINRQREKTPKGNNHPKCKFSEQDIINIFLSKEKTTILAKNYNVHRDTIYKIRVGINCSSITKNLSNK